MIVKNQHYVQRRLLKQFFTTSHSLFALDFEEATIKSPSLEGICSEKFYYEHVSKSINFVEDTMNRYIEDSWPWIEGAASDPWKVLNNDAKLRIKNYMGYQTLRSPFHRVFLREIKEFAERISLAIGIVDKGSAARQIHISQLSSFSIFRKLLSNHDVYLVVSDQPDFIISDSGAFRQNRILNSTNEMQDGFADEGMELLMPISPNVCAVAYDVRLGAKIVAAAIGNDDDPLTFNTKKGPMQISRSILRDFYAPLCSTHVHKACPEFVKMHNDGQAKHVSRWLIGATKDAIEPYQKLLEEKRDLRMIDKFDYVGLWRESFVSLYVKIMDQMPDKPKPEIIRMLGLEKYQKAVDMLISQFGGYEALCKDIREKAALNDKLERPKLADYGLDTRNDG